MYIPPKSADELIERYIQGERMFHGTFLNGEAIETSLPGIDLSHSRLHVIFSDVDLTGASFYNADLSFTHFEANLLDANFTYADLGWTDFGRSNLTNATFDGASLHNTQFKSSNLDNCDFKDAGLYQTIFIDVSLVSLCASKWVNHVGPSYFDHRTVVRSMRAPNLKEVLKNMGTPAVFVEYLVDCAKSLSGAALSSLLQSTFISFSKPDEAFAKRLNDALHSNGVRTFFFPEHAVPGRKLFIVMHEGVNEFDRVIVICSEASLNSSKGVRNEIKQTLARESRDEGASYLIPIRLDDYIFNWSPDEMYLATEIRDRVITDFSNLDTVPGKFEVSLQKLITALKKELPNSSFQEI